MRFDTKSLEKGLDRLINKSDVALRVYCDTAALKMQNYAKKNAPWTDRTGNARARLKGASQETPTGYRISISHGVDYGVDLEFKHEKRYAIIPDTLDFGKSSIIPGFNKMLERL